MSVRILIIGGLALVIAAKRWGVSSASRRLRSQARVDAFTLKACIDSLQRQLVNIQILTATFQAETQSLAQQFDSM